MANAPLVTLRVATSPDLVAAISTHRGLHSLSDNNDYIGGSMALVDERFPTLVRQTLIPVLARHGFEVTSEDTCCVETASQRLQARAVFDPRGELDVEVFPLGFQTWAGWSFTGMVGRASLNRLLELAFV